MAGRTVAKWTRIYNDGYDMSGTTRSYGPLAVTFEEPDLTTLGDPVKNALQGQPTINVGTINAVFDNTTGASSHAVFNTTTDKHVLMFAIGNRAAPVQGDEVFCCQLNQKDFMTDTAGVYITASFSGWSANAASQLYGMPWGALLHAKAAETAVNASAGVDDRGAATTKGGYMCYHLFTSNGTVTLKTQDSADNSTFADLVTSGSINGSVTPVANMVALSNTATVRRYLRWQLVFGTATTATFAIGFVRI